MRFLYTAEYDYLHPTRRELYSYDELHLDPLPDAELPRTKNLY
jgi:hypothetical protein